MGNAVYTHLPRYIVVRGGAGGWYVAALEPQTRTDGWHEPDYQLISPRLTKAEAGVELARHQAADLEKNGPPGAPKQRKEAARDGGHA